MSKSNILSVGGWVWSAGVASTEGWRVGVVRRSSANRALEGGCGPPEYSSADRALEGGCGPPE